MVAAYDAHLLDLKTHDIAGFSIIEYIIAVAIFVIIASASVAAIIGGFTSTRLAEEQTQAGVLAAEGSEATQSIRNQGWNNLTNGAHGLAQSGGIWTFSGTSDAIGKFTRIVTISDVNRSGGDIVTTGGTLDPETKKVSVVVSWAFTSGRNNGVVVNQYLTRWQVGKNIIGIPPTPTPVISTPTPTPVNCNSYCISNYSLPGTCTKPHQCTGIKAGKILNCTGPNVCCCQ